MRNHFIWPLLAALTASCAESVTSASGLPAAPRLIAPAAGARLNQNDPSTGCTGFGNRGAGKREVFQWAAVTGAASYELFVENVGAQTPIVNQVVAGTSFERLECGSFVTDEFLLNWHWRVRS